MSKIEISKEILRTMKLPYPGEVFVEEDQEVKPDTLIAKTELLDIQPGYFDIGNRFDKNFSLEEFKNVVKIKIGDYVSRGDVIAEYNSEEIEAPYYGYVEHVSESGQYILIRQKVSENEDPLEIDAAKELGISSRAIMNTLQVEVGQEVIRGQGIAGDIEIVRTPMSGVVEEINSKEGKVVIKPVYKPKLLYANVYGTVKEVDDKQTISILTTIDLIQGMFGIGQECTGKLVKFEKASKGDIALKTNKVTKMEINSAIEKGISGIIAPCADADDLIEIFGTELYRGVTGIEDKPVSLILTEGFGNIEMEEDIIKGFESSLEKNVTVSPKTNLQTPIRYPEIYIYKN